MKNERIEKLKEKAVNLPLTPGVYIMKDVEGKVIYVGKAKNLKNRVSSYFTRIEAHNKKTYALVSHVESFDVMKTKTELEALLLERNLIREHMPQFNVLLRDDKGVCYIRLTKDEYPVFEIVNHKPSGEFFGPYYTRGTAKALLDSAGRTFLLPECNKVTKKERACLCHHLGRCTAPCVNAVSKEEYLEQIENAVRFLKGDTDAVVALLTEKMELAAERLDFEKAAFYRDRLLAVNKIKESQSIIFKEDKNAHGVAVIRSESNLAVSVLPVRNGLMLSATSFVPSAADGDGSLFFEALIAYYGAITEPPKRIYLSEQLDEIELFKAFLFEKFNKNIPVSVPKAGSVGATIVSYAMGAAKEYLIGFEKSWGESERAAEDLMRLLGLSFAPKRIEVYDISHTAGSDTVGAMTVFEDFKPQKSAYRRFAVKADVNKDDTAALYEVISRRLDDYLSGKEGFSVLPDLFIADGGEAQRNTVAKALSERGITVPVAGLKKDSHHRTKSLVTEVNEVKLASYRELWTALTRLQDEVHRFAISYHKQKRSSGVKGLSLQKIEGIGPKKARLILSHFKTLSALREATREDIFSVKGLDKKTAKLLWEAVEKGEI